MGGKGRRRREKNYLAAHGGPTRLPPPPDSSKLDALPSKLRKLMSFTAAAAAAANDSAKVSKNNGQKEDRNARKGGDREKKIQPAKDDGQVMSPLIETADEVAQTDAGERRKKKRKRKQVKDLRFEKEMESERRSKRQERKKKYWEAKKKKQKKAKTQEGMDFPGSEKIKFGDVVEAPPKLAVVPKAPKSIQSASKERLRLQAIEAYRNRKGWTSRPGLQFPPAINSSDR